MKNQHELKETTLSGTIDADYILEIKDDSMAGDGIRKGDLAFIKKMPVVDHGFIAAVVLDGVATLRRVFVEDDGYRLSASNSEYIPRLTKDDVILGEFMGLYKKAQHEISLAAARINAGLTQDDVAKKMSKSKQTIGSWENGRTAIDAANLVALCEIYGVSVDDIYFPHIQEPISPAAQNDLGPEEAAVAAFFLWAEMVREGTLPNPARHNEFLLKRSPELEDSLLAAEFRAFVGGMDFMLHCDPEKLTK